jgi:hypothetical protein
MLFMFLPYNFLKGRRRRRRVKVIRRGEVRMRRKNNSSMSLSDPFPLKSFQIL